MWGAKGWAHLSPPSFNSSQADRDGQVQLSSSVTEPWLYWVVPAVKLLGTYKTLFAYVHYVKIFSMDTHGTVNSELDIEFWFHMLFNTTFGEHCWFFTGCVSLFLPSDKPCLLVGSG